MIRKPRNTERLCSILRDIWKSIRLPNRELFYDTSGRLYTKINLGGGDFRREGWCNLDLSQGYNVTRWLLRYFPDESIEVVYSSHFLEHLHPETVRRLLRDVCRVLKKNGIVRITGPDIDRLTDAVLQGEDHFLTFVDAFYDRKAMGCDYVKWYLYMGGNPDCYGQPNAHVPTQHCWMVSANIIIYLLIASGFNPSNVYKSTFRQSIVLELREACFDNREALSFYVEAVK